MDYGFKLTSVWIFINFEEVQSCPETVGLIIYVLKIKHI